MSIPLDPPPLWTEEKYLVLGKTPSRVDLIDGALWIGPIVHTVHQEIVGNLLDNVRPVAKAAGMRALHHVNVRLGPSRILGPDLVVARTYQFSNVVQAHEVVLIGEVVEPSTQLIDCVLRQHLYAEAGIQWYLLVEPSLPDWKSITLRLYRLHGGKYSVHDVATRGETLVSEEPFPLAIRASSLLDDLVEA